MILYFRKANHKPKEFLEKMILIRGWVGRPKSRQEGEEVKTCPKGYVVYERPL